MDKSFDGVLDAVSNGRFLLIGMQKKERVSGWETSSWNTTSIFFLPLQDNVDFPEC